MATKELSSLVVHVLSDSIGETGEMVVKAASSQFPAYTQIRRVPYISTSEEAIAVLQDAAAANSMVAYTLVDPKLRMVVRKTADELGIEAVDLLGPMIGSISRRLGAQPVGEPGLIRKLDESYYNKVEAIEFAVKFDDGKDPWGLSKADMVIIGVSRTSKTPLCMYLALRGFRAINVPIIPEVPVPEALFSVERRRIFGLTIKPELLLDIRRERLRTLGITQSFDYARMERILSELHYSEGIMRRVGCPVIDVTNRAVEDTAHKILEIYRG